MTFLTFSDLKVRFQFQGLAAPQAIHCRARWIVIRKDRETKCGSTKLKSTLIRRMQRLCDIPNAASPGCSYKATLFTCCPGVPTSYAKKIEQDSPAFEESNDLRNTLQEYLSHYKAVLAKHEIALPFFEQP
jgi:hypothetical protein